MIGNVEAMMPWLYHLDHTEKPYSLGAAYIDGDIFVGTFVKGYPKRRISVAINDERIKIARADKRTPFQVVIAPRPDGNGNFDKSEPLPLLTEPVRALILGRSTTRGIITIPEGVLRPDGLGDFLAFADILAGRIEEEQQKIAARQLPDFCSV